MMNHRPCRRCPRMATFLAMLLLCCLMMARVRVWAHKDCGIEEPTEANLRSSRDAEKSFFGKFISDMSTGDFSRIHNALLGKRKRRWPQRLFSATLPKALVDMLPFLCAKPWDNSYRLVNVPIVYHILPNQGSGLRRPNMTEAQREHATQTTSARFNIYDKSTKQSVQFVSYVTDETIVHPNVVTKLDCSDLANSVLQSVVTKATEWQFKIHVIICEFQDISGSASFPENYAPTDPRHNLFRMDHRALACNDDNGNFLCELTNGQAVSHSRWWRTRSNVLSHEIGHLFGLYHTFTDGCDDGDGIADTPADGQTSPFGCPGLLPYDKDRDLFVPSLAPIANAGASADTCVGGQSDVCSSNTCAACCVRPSGNDECPFDLSNAESVTEAMVSFPDCCSGNSAPINSCPNTPGVDPLNNVMSYAPDFCSNEFTPGQMTRMMAQISEFKPYLYCSFGTRLDATRCQGVPCFSGATSPNCR